MQKNVHCSPSCKISRDQFFQSGLRRKISKKYALVPCFLFHLFHHTTLPFLFLFTFSFVLLFGITAGKIDLYGSMLVIGVIAHIGIQVFINIAVATNTMPNTGIPLPFISYGGSSLVFLLLEMGLVLSVSRYIKIKK